MSTQDFDRIYLFTLSDLDGRATARDRFYGLLDLNGDPKPSYTALKYFLEVTGPNLTPGDPPAAATGHSTQRPVQHRLEAPRRSQALDILVGQRHRHCEFAGTQHCDGFERLGQWAGRSSQIKLAIIVGLMRSQQAPVRT